MVSKKTMIKLGLSIDDKKIEEELPTLERPHVLVKPLPTRWKKIDLS